MKQGYKKASAILFILLWWGGAAQTERPNATPYTIETTYKKLLKEYPTIVPIKALKSKKIISNENMVYRKMDDVELKADVYYPKKTKKRYPGILLVHGGGWISGSKENLRVMAQRLAEKGFVTMAVNYRLADVAKFPAAIEDLSAAVTFLNNSTFPMDHKKVAILGASAGGQLASLVGMRNESIKAIVNIDGIVSFVHPEAKEGTYAGYWLGGMREDNIKAWNEASPLEFIHPSAPPILFINSAQPRFHAGRDDLVKKFSEWGIYYEIHTLPNTPHSFWLVHPWFEPTLKHTVQFLHKVFK